MASAAKQAARNREILIAKAEGEDTNEIAKRYDLSPTRVRQILADGSSGLTDADHDPVDVAIEHRAEYAMILEKAKALFEAIPDSNPSPKVGALRLYLAALNDLCTWDQMIGFVSPYQVHQEIDSRRVTRVLLDGLEAAGIPKAAVEEAAQLLTNAGTPALPAGSPPSPQA